MLQTDAINIGIYVFALSEKSSPVLLQQIFPFLYLTTYVQGEFKELIYSK